MRMITPSPGEAYDRLTILKLKIDHSDRIEFKQEHDAIETYIVMENKWQIPTPLAIELAKINARLWDLEDAQRKLVNSADKEEVTKEFIEFGNNAIRVLRLNDARAETVKKINEALGINHPEKLHEAH